MLTPVEKILFVFVVLASLSLTYVTFGRMARIIRRGQGQIRIKDVPRFFWEGAIALLSQGAILRRRQITSLFHYGVAWGFTFYLLVDVADVAEGYIEGFQLFGDTILGSAYRLLADIFSVSSLVAVIYFVVRRFLAKDPSLSVDDPVKLNSKAKGGVPKDSLLVATFIFLHVGFRFLGQSFLIAHEGGDAAQPFASLVANLWEGFSASAQNTGWHVSWWVALGLILAFLPYFPYTKHAHLFMGPLNIATRRKRRALGALDALDFEDESIEQFGAARMTDLAQTQILDAFACIMCNRCQDACPAYVTGKELSPAALEINKRYYLRENLNGLGSGGDDDKLLLDYAISESAVWACTACGACVEVCPVGNEPMFDIMHIRQNQVLMESAFPQELKGAFNGMERQANPWGMTEDRMEWAAPLPFEVPTVVDNPDYEVLMWVGCAGAFDPSAQDIARATATVLHSAGVNFAVLGNDESCTGDSARRAGNEYLFFEMAMMNIEKLTEIGADKKPIVTNCPHCFHTLAKEYPDLGGSFQVFHHTQFIADLIGKGKLVLKDGRVLEQVTFHDPCYLGRHNREYDAPRNALAEAGMVLLEMERTRSNSFCCGAGGAQMWKEEEHGTQTVNANRFAEAQATGANALAVGCPFCARMLTDAGTEADSDMKVLDVAQLVAEAL